jgi:adenylate cyclase class 2
MAWEVEQKFAVADRARLRQALDAAGVAWQEPLEQADHYWNHPSRDFAQTDEALRVRQVGSENFITYKGPRVNSATKTRQELEFPLQSGPEVPDQIGQILVALGFRPVATVRKRRQGGVLAWEGTSIHIACDEVQGVGTYVELETVVETENLEFAQQRVLSLANHLGLTGFERRSYLELLLERSPK